MARGGRIGKRGSFHVGSYLPENSSRPTGLQVVLGLLYRTGRACSSAEAVRSCYKNGRPRDLMGGGCQLICIAPPSIWYNGGVIPSCVW